MRTLPRRSFYMLRHGQTEHNAREVISDPDTNLTELGIEQAKAAKPLIEHEFKSPDLCYMVTSELFRTRQTHGHAKPDEWVTHLTKDHRINERAGGTMANGKVAYTEWEKINETCKDKPELRAPDWPNGEEYTDLDGIKHKAKGVERIRKQGKRMHSALRYHLNECPEEKTPLFVCHEGSMKRVASVLGHSIRHFDNGALYKFEPAPDGISWNISRIAMEEGKMVKRPVESLPSRMAALESVTPGSIPSL